MITCEVPSRVLQKCCHPQKQLTPIRFAYLDECTVQIDIVRHDDGTNDSDGLQQLFGTTARTVREEHALDHLPLVWSHHDILNKRLVLSIPIPKYSKLE